MAQACEDAHLAILHLAEAPTILAMHPNRTVSLLHETGFVNQQNAMRMPTQEAVDLRSHLVHQLPFIPGQVADKLLHRLVITFGNITMDALQILVLLRSQQP